MSITAEIGIMQGRLSPIINNKIQAFPLKNWQNEFNVAQKIGFSSIEWIVEKPLNLNPLLSSTGVNEIKKVISSSNVRVDFICADIFMQEPIINQKESLSKAKKLIHELITKAKEINAKYIEIPFVDNSSLKNKNIDYLIKFFNSLEYDLIKNEIFINLETDLNPYEFSRFLSKLSSNFGANYDIGNSASLGYDYRNELKSYWNRINNVHIKDRMLGGSTVEFGLGNSDISGVLKFLSDSNYNKGITIQGARGANDIYTAKNQFNYTKRLIDKLNYEQ